MKKAPPNARDFFVKEVRGRSLSSMCQWLETEKILSRATGNPRLSPLDAMVSAGEKKTGTVTHTTIAVFSGNTPLAALSYNGNAIIRWALNPEARKESNAFKKECGITPARELVIHFIHRMRGDHLITTPLRPQARAFLFSRDGERLLPPFNAVVSDHYVQPSEDYAEEKFEGPRHIFLLHPDARNQLKPSVPFRG